MGYWSGLHTRTPRDRVVAWDGYGKIIDLQETLLKTGGKKAVVWKRLDSGRRCFCAKGGMPQSPHNVCYGTGWVGGYEQFNMRDIIFYRNEGIISVFDAYNGSSKDYPIVGNSVVTDWLDGAGGVEIRDRLRWWVERDGGVRIYISFDNTNWIDIKREVVVFPVERFRAKIENIDNRFEVLKLRISRKDNNWWYFSENPPLRLEQLFRWGIDTVPFDVRVWTVIGEDELVLRTGDLLYWLEGYYTGTRYSVVNNRKAQFVREKDDGVVKPGSSGLLTQVLSMRLIKSAEQEFRVW